MPRSPAKPDQDSTRPALLAPLRRVLRPLIRLLIAQGVTFPQLAAILKSVYVESAEQDFRIEGRPQTDSRISLLTGVHRKDVRRLSDEAQRSLEAMPASVSLGAQLVARWTGDRRYQDRHGAPLPLPRLAREGGEVSFEGLVASVSKDIRSRAVLDEWLRLGVVELDDRDRVQLRSEAFVASEGFEEKAFYFGHNLHDHLAAAVHNVMGGQPAFLERSVHYDALSMESIEQLRGMAREAGMDVLKALNREAMRLEKRDSVGGAAAQRFTFGIYFYAEPAAPDDDETPS